MCVNKRRKQKQEYYQKNRERILVKQRERRKKNLEKIRKYAREYYHKALKNNPDSIKKRAERDHKRWLKIKNNLELHKKYLKRQRIANRKYHDDLKMELFRLLGAKCQNPKCETLNQCSNHPEILQIHHPDKKQEQLTKVFLKKISIKLKEGKTISIKLLCPNCHALEHVVIDEKGKRKVLLGHK